MIRLCSGSCKLINLLGMQDELNEKAKIEEIDEKKGEGIEEALNRKTCVSA